MMPTRRVNLMFAIFLAILAVMTGYLQYFGSPALCWCPVHFTGAMVFYVNSLCFLTDRYYIPGDPFPEPLPTEAFVNHFKWTPFALLFLATLYVIPEITVRIGSSLFKSNVDSFLNLSQQSNRGDKETRAAAIQQLTISLQIKSVENANRSKFRRCKFLVLPSIAFYVRMKEVGSKLMYFLGSLIPLALLWQTFSQNFDMNHNLAPVKNETYFPKEIFCDFEIRQIQTIQRYTVQCHLPANDMFERISLLVGFLALVVSSASSCDVICWLVARIFEPRISTYVKKHMKMMTKLNTKYDAELFSEFTKRYLGTDAMCLIRLIGQNSSETVVCQILSRLLEDFENKSNLHNESPLPPPYAADDMTVQAQYEGSHRL